MVCKREREKVGSVQRERDCENKSNEVVRWREDDRKREVRRRHLITGKILISVGHCFVHERAASIEGE